MHGKPRPDQCSSCWVNKQDRPAKAIIVQPAATGRPAITLHLCTYHADKYERNALVLGDAITRTPIVPLEDRVNAKTAAALAANRKRPLYRVVSQGRNQWQVIRCLDAYCVEGGFFTRESADFACQHWNADPEPEPEPRPRRRGEAGMPIRITDLRWDSEAREFTPAAYPALCCTWEDFVAANSDLPADDLRHIFLDLEHTGSSTYDGGTSGAFRIERAPDTFGPPPPWFRVATGHKLDTGLAWKRPLGVRRYYLITLQSDAIPTPLPLNAWQPCELALYHDGRMIGKPIRGTFEALTRLPASFTDETFEMLADIFTYAAIR